MSIRARVKVLKARDRVKARAEKGKFSEAGRLKRIASWIDAFDKRTSDEEYTDVGDAWDLFNDIRDLAKGEDV